MLYLKLFVVPPRGGGTPHTLTNPNLNHSLVVFGKCLAMLSHWKVNLKSVFMSLKAHCLIYMSLF